MSKVKAAEAAAAERLKQAVMYLKYARYQVELAFGEYDSDSGQETIDDIDGILEDLDADIIFLQSGNLTV